MATPIFTHMRESVRSMISRFRETHDDEYPDIYLQFGNRIIANSLSYFTYRRIAIKIQLASIT